MSLFLWDFFVWMESNDMNCVWMKERCIFSFNNQITNLIKSKLANWGIDTQSHNKNHIIFCAKRINTFINVPMLSFYVSSRIDYVHTIDIERGVKDKERKPVSNIVCVKKKVPRRRWAFLKFYRLLKKLWWNGKWMYGYFA